MNERNLVICDKELDYAKGLGENVLHHKEYCVRVYVCSAMEHVLQLSKEKQIHLLVVDEKYAYEDRNRVGAKQVFVLSRGKVSDLGTEEHAVKKYQCADSIIHKIFEIYTESTREAIYQIAGNKETKIIAVYSPIHRVGKTTFALELGKEYAKRRKTIYINMEEYAGFEGADQKARNLGDLLYYMKQGSDNFPMRLEELVLRKELLDYLLPMQMSLDLKEIRDEEWLSLLKQICENSAYERIILDIGEGVQGLFPILQLCHRIYMPILNEDNALRKRKKYESNLERLNLQKLLDKTYQFVMPENIHEYARMRAKEDY